MTATTFIARDVTDAATAASQCAILPLFQDTKLAGAALKLDKASSGSIKAALALGDFSAKSGESLMLPGTDAAKRILLIGCGDAKKFDREGARKFSRTLYHALANKQASEAMLHLAGLGLKEKEAKWMLTYLARHLIAASYRYTETVSKPRAAMKLTRLIINTKGAIQSRLAGSALREGKAIGLGVNEAANLANLPGNICTPFLSGTTRPKIGAQQCQVDCQHTTGEANASVGHGRSTVSFRRQ